MKKALITGIAGQDGSYLSELLLDKGYEVYGIVRRGTSDDRLERLSGVVNETSLFETDISDLSSIARVLSEARPDEIYNLASQSHVSHSFKEPFLTVQT